MAGSFGQKVRASCVERAKSTRRRWLEVVSQGKGTRCQTRRSTNGKRVSFIASRGRNEDKRRRKGQKRENQRHHSGRAEKPSSKVCQADRPRASDGRIVQRPNVAGPKARVSLVSSVAYVYIAHGRGLPCRGIVSCSHTRRVKGGEKGLCCGTAVQQQIDTSPRPRTLNVLYKFAVAQLNGV